MLFRSQLDAEKQDRFIREAADKKWQDMNYRYVDAKYIQGFLNNISLLCIPTRDAGRNSYSGGAITGIAVKTAELSSRPTKDPEDYDKVMDVLSRCVASNYLEKMSVTHSSTNYTVFYLNRWLCVHYDLPLGYGGWKGVSILQAAAMCSEKTVQLSDQVSLYDYEEEEMG